MAKFTKYRRNRPIWLKIISDSAIGIGSITSIGGTLMQLPALAMIMSGISLLGLVTGIVYKNIDSNFAEIEKFEETTTTVTQTVEKSSTDGVAKDQ